MGKYDDIIMLPHHVSKEHTPMDMETRAAQFSPFAALTGYEDAIAETERITEEKIELDENEKQILDEKLSLLMENNQTEVLIKYFVKDQLKNGGKYVTSKGKVAKIDVYDKIIVMDNKTSIEIDDIIDIEF